jgi:hypothetical protein
MCLTSAKRIKIEEDRVCYKIERYYKGEWVTFCQNCVLPIGLNVINDYDESIFEIEKHFLKKAYKIYGGAFHSFCFLRDAIKIHIKLNRIYDKYEYRIIECKIPKDSKCFLGKFDVDLLSYASEKIIITDEVVYQR